MKKLVSLLLAALMLLGMATAALAEDAPATVTITSLSASRSNWKCPTTRSASPSSICLL